MIYDSPILHKRVLHGLYDSPILYILYINHVSTVWIIHFMRNIRTYPVWLLTFVIFRTHLKSHSYCQSRNAILWHIRHTSSDVTCGISSYTNMHDKYNYLEIYSHEVKYNWGLALMCHMLMNIVTYQRRTASSHNYKSIIQSRNYIIHVTALYT
jgi:hypothetical protein